MRKLLIPALLGLALATGTASAQTAAQTAAPAIPALAGGYFPIDAKATGRTYHIHVRLPEGYAADPARRYPVVYVLDGDSLFPILAATHLFLTVDDKLPEAIVVGIAYGGFDPAINKRSIDFMPPGKDVAPDRAGAPAFQRFLKDELLPAVETRYRADPARRILFGQSRSGSFVLYSAFTDPDLFWGRIASNPAIPPTRDFFYGTPASAGRRDLHLFVAHGAHDLPHLKAETLPWLDAWTRRSGLPWTLTPLPIAHGSHAANSADGYRAAMRRLFGIDTM